MKTIVEKTRPTSLDEILSQEHVVTILKRWIKNNTIQHAIFSGPPGTGKTSTAYAFASDYFNRPIGIKANDEDYEELNGSNSRGIDAVRGHIKKWGSTPALTKRDGVALKKVMVIDEADKLTPDAWGAMRVVMEKNQETCMYIFCMNHPEKVKEKAIFSRAPFFPFHPLKPEDMKDRFIEVAKDVDIKFANEEIVMDILKHRKYDGDYRRIINDTLQKLVGIDHAVEKKDIPWIYENSYLTLIKNMIKSGDFFKMFFNEYRSRNIDCSIFIRELSEEIGKMPFELAKILAEADARLNSGGDDIVQMSYILHGCEKYSENIKH